MSIEISDENERYLQQSIERGIYRDRTAALDAAVALLRQRDQLRAEVRAGIEQADAGQLMPAEDVFRRLEERAREIERAARPKA
jgi:putative addiction module CopG family antidote